MSKASFHEEVASLPIASSHEHHREDEFHAALNLDRLFANSYVGWCGPIPQPTLRDRERYLDERRYNSYFVWLQKALQDLYDLDEIITAENWDLVSERISNAHQKAGHHIDILVGPAKYRSAVQDTYWNPGSDVGHPELFKVTFRIDSFFHGYHPEAKDNNGVSPIQTYKLATKSLSEYLDAMEDEIRMRRSRSVALKCAIAYERSLDFSHPSLELAEAAFGKHPNEISPEEKKAFGDVVFHRVLRIAAELDLPLQVHLGLAKISGSNPMLFEPVIAQYPTVRFVLFHGGYPWCREVGGIAHNYSNVVLDLCWLPLISTSAAVQSLHEYIDVAQSSSRITWGGDNWTSEESYGASLAFRYVLARVLEEKVSEGAFGWAEAARLARKIAYENAEAIY